MEKMRNTRKSLRRSKLSVFAPFLLLMALSCLPSAYSAMTSPVQLPGGGEGAVQFYDRGVFNGTQTFRYDKATKVLTVSSQTVTWIVISTASVNRIIFPDGTSFSTGQLYPAAQRAYFPYGAEGSDAEFDTISLSGRRPVDDTLPDDGDPLIYDAITGHWKPGQVIVGGVISIYPATATIRATQGIASTTGTFTGLVEIAELSGSSGTFSTLWITTITFADGSELVSMNGYGKIYSATATPSFPYGISASSAEFSNGVYFADGGASNQMTLNSLTGEIETRGTFGVGRLSISTFNANVNYGVYIQAHDLSQNDGFGIAATTGTDIVGMAGLYLYPGSNPLAYIYAGDGTAPVLISSNALSMQTQRELRFYDSDDSNYVGFKATSTLTANKIWILPLADGTSGQILVTDGLGNLSFQTNTGSSGTVIGDNLGNHAATKTLYAQYGLIGTTAALSGHVLISSDVTVTGDADFNYLEAYTLASQHGIIGATGTFTESLTVASFTSTGVGYFGGSYYDGGAVDPVVVLSRTRTGTGNSHSFVDATIFNKTGGDAAMNSFDGRVQFYGTNNYDHYVGAQISPAFTTTGTTNKYYGFFSAPSIYNGTLTNSYGLYVVDPSGPGTLTNNYGIYLEDLNKGASLNYAIYSAGSAPSYLGGPITAYSFTGDGSNLTGLGLLSDPTGHNMFAMGAGNDSFMGANNSGAGHYALTSIDTGEHNSAFGYSSLYSLEDGHGNSAFGSGSLYSSTSSYNTGIGIFSGFGITEGYGNTMLGASLIEASYNQVTTGNRNISIGNNVAVQSPTGSNQLSIGNYIYGTGLDGTGSTISNGKIGIGKKDPAYDFDVAGDIQSYRILVDTVQFSDGTIMYSSASFSSSNGGLTEPATYTWSLPYGVSGSTFSFHTSGAYGSTGTLSFLNNVFRLDTYNPRIPSAPIYLSFYSDIANGFYFVNATPGKNYSTSLSGTSWNYSGMGPFQTHSADGIRGMSLPMWGPTNQYIAKFSDSATNIDSRIGYLVGNSTWGYWTNYGVKASTISFPDGTFLTSTSTLGSSTPPGLDTEVSFNDSGVWGTDPSFHYHKSSNQLQVDGSVITDQIGDAGANGITGLNFYPTEDAEYMTFNLGDVEVGRWSRAGFLVDAPISASNSTLTLNGNGDGGYGTRGILKGISTVDNAPTFVFGDGGASANYAMVALYGRNNDYGAWGDRIFEVNGMDDRIDGDKIIGGFMLESNYTEGTPHDSAFFTFTNTAGTRLYLGQHNGGWYFNPPSYSDNPGATAHINGGTIQGQTSETVGNADYSATEETGYTSNYGYGMTVEYYAYAYKIAGDAATFYSSDGVYSSVSINTDYGSRVAITVNVPEGDAGVRIHRSLDGYDYSTYYEFGTSGTYYDDNNYGGGFNWYTGGDHPPTPVSPYSYTGGNYKALRTDSGDVEFFKTSSDDTPIFRVDSETSQMTYTGESDHDGFIVKKMGYGGDGTSVPFVHYDSSDRIMVSFTNGEYYGEVYGSLQLFGEQDNGSYFGEIDFMNRDRSGDKRSALIVGKRGADSSYGGIEFGVLNNGSLVDGLEVMPDQTIKVWNAIDYVHGAASTPTDTVNVASWAELKLNGTSYRIPLYQ